MIIFILSIYVILSSIYIIYLILHRHDKQVEEEKLWPCAIIVDGWPKIIWLTKEDFNLDGKEDDIFDEQHPSWIP